MKICFSTNYFADEGPGYVVGQIYEALNSKHEVKLIIHDIRDAVEFDKQATKDIESCDLFISGLGSSLYQVRKAHKLGAKTLLMRFSTHHLRQQRVLQDIYAFYGRKVFEKFLLNRALKEYKESDYFLVLSEYCKYTYILNGINSDKVFVVHPGMDTERFSFAEPHLNPFRMLFVGTNAIRKGLLYLLKAWKEVDINGELVIRSTISLPPIKNVVYLPNYVDNLPKLYHDSSLTVLPSLEEGFAATNLESFACGRPVISTNVTGIEDVMTDHKEGILIPAGSVEAIKEAIQYLAGNPNELKRMGKEARKTVEKYTWDFFRENVVTTIKKLL